MNPDPSIPIPERQEDDDRKRNGMIHKLRTHNFGMNSMVQRLLSLFRYSLGSSHGQYLLDLDGSNVLKCPGLICVPKSTG